jgi:uncharacterized membrane protein YbhN (UPF0104 family)
MGESYKPTADDVPGGYVRAHQEGGRLSRARKMLALRIVISGAMLALLVPRIHFGSLFPHWTIQSFGWLMTALAVTLVGIVISAARWQRVLFGLGLDARIPRLLTYYLAGLFVANFLPSTIGGDVLRVRRLATQTQDTPATFASVVLERLTGWVVLPVMTFTGLAINRGLLRVARSESQIALGVSVATLALLVTLLALAASPRLGGRLAARANWLRFVGAVHLGVDRFRRRPGAAAGVLAVAFLYQFAVVGAAWLGGEALGIHIGFSAMLAFMPVVAIVQVLPITIGGLGIREGAFVLFLHPLGVSQTHAIALGLLVYLMNLAVSLLGAPAFAVGGPSRPSQQAVA